MFRIEAKETCEVPPKTTVVLNILKNEVLYNVPSIHVIRGMGIK